MAPCCSFVGCAKSTFGLARFLIVMLLVTILDLVLPILRFLLPQVIQRHFHIAAPVVGHNAAGKIRVAVIGGGIAGTSAAWALARSGSCDVVLYENRAVLGGCAKTYEWAQPRQTKGKSRVSAPVRTGLSVLAWPVKYFRHYELLVKYLKIPTTVVQPAFLIGVENSSSGEVSKTWCHGEANEIWRHDMERWDRAVHFARRVNDFCARVSWWIHALLFRKTSGTGDSSSLYSVTFFNPLNVIPSRILCQWGFGLSDDFWNCVIVPVYSSSFLTTKLNTMPACIMPALDDIISVGARDSLKPLNSWVRDSKEVFDLMTTQIVDCGGRVVLNATISSVEVSPDYFGPDQNTIKITFENGTAHYCDQVVFACPSNTVDELTKKCKYFRGLHNPLFNEIIPRVRYENERDDNFVTGYIHQERRVFPDAVRDEFFTNRRTNFIRVRGNPADGVVENTFCLSTWYPAALASASAAAGKPADALTNDELFDYFVTYNATKDNVCHEKEIGTVDNSWAHPQFTMKQLALAGAIAKLQGRYSAYYCGSYCTPGNGHDLSLLSGFAVASKIVGNNYYPFHGEGDAPKADSVTRADFDLLRELMGL